MSGSRRNTQTRAALRHHGAFIFHILNFEIGFLTTTCFLSNPVPLKRRDHISVGREATSNVLRREVRNIWKPMGYPQISAMFSFSWLNWWLEPDTHRERKTERGPNKTLNESCGWRKVAIVYFSDEKSQTLPLRKCQTSRINQGEHQWQFKALLPTMS